MTWPEYEHHILIVHFRVATEVGVGKVDARATSPVTKQAVFDVVRGDRALHQMVIC